MTLLTNPIMTPAAVAQPGGVLRVGCRTACALPLAWPGRSWFPEPDFVKPPVPTCLVGHAGRNAS